ncbi:hypothetical protein D5H75_32440 [Bailinhaonella thermotolerans]|uniref:Uncharacterized protein n=1 Tax=Bailinhaonella thermotolerans TaxID=1070861 RepID=A0A3A4AVV2_9ACTN|nr:hypothetical protein D5H75_32440 [Bailinhaonella thermotolerans]
MLIRITTWLSAVGAVHEALPRRASEVRTHLGGPPLPRAAKAPIAADSTTTKEPSMTDLRPLPPAAAA